MANADSMSRSNVAFSIDLSQTSIQHDTSFLSQLGTTLTRDNRIMFRIPKDTPVTLDSKDVKILVTEGAELFARLTQTPDAEEYLRYHEKLKEVLDKW